MLQLPEQIMDSRSGVSLNPSPNLYRSESVWNARRLKQQSDKDIDLLLNRIQLLKREQQIEQRKIEDAMKQTCETFQRKKQNQVVVEKKLNGKRQEEEYLRIVQQKNYEMKLQQTAERKIIQEALHQMKRKERDMIKQMSLENQKQIEEQRQRSIQKNQRIKEKIQNINQQSKSHIHEFWTQKLSRIQEGNFSEKTKCIQIYGENEYVLNKLEEQEMNLLAKLQQSQNQKELLKQRLFNARNLPPNEYERIYGNNDDIIIQKQDKPPFSQKSRGSTGLMLYQQKPKQRQNQNPSSVQKNFAQRQIAKLQQPDKSAISMSEPNKYSLDIPPKKQKDQLIQDIRELTEEFTQHNQQDLINQQQQQNFEHQRSLTEEEPTVSIARQKSPRENQLSSKPQMVLSAIDSEQNQNVNKEDDK